MLRNAQHCDLVAAPFIRPPRPQWRPHSDHTGDTQGLLGCRSRPVRAIQSSTVTAPIPFKPLQTPAKRCNLLQFSSKRLARKCNILQSNASKCFILFRAHLCTSSVRSSKTTRVADQFRSRPATGFAGDSDRSTFVPSENSIRPGFAS